MKKKDIILLLSVICSALIILAVIAIVGGLDKGDMVVVTIDGEISEKLPLSKDTEYKIISDNGGYNILIIKDRRAYIAEASCPDKTCVNMGDAKELSPVVCLPNKVIVSIEKD